MFVVVIGVVAHTLNKNGKGPSVCVCFSEDPPGTFLSFKKKRKSPPAFELPPTFDGDGDGDGDGFPQKIYIPPRG